MSTRGISTDKTPDWRDKAACRVEDADVMFPDPSDKRGTRIAQAICLACPVRQQCLEHAMAVEGGCRRESRYGVFGGLDGDQRYRLYCRLRPSHQARLAQTA